MVSAMTSLDSERISAAEITSDWYKINFSHDFRGITRVNLTLAESSPFLPLSFWALGEYNLI